MGDSIKRFLRAAHEHCAICWEASKMLPIPLPCQWPDSNRDAHLDQEPSQGTIRVLFDRATVEAVSLGDGPARVLRLFEETKNLWTLARDSDVDKWTFADAHANWSTAYEALSPYGSVAATKPATVITKPTKPKRIGGWRGEKHWMTIVGRLEVYHQYAKYTDSGDRGDLNTKPIGNNKLAKLLFLDQGVTSRFFKAKFGNWKGYVKRCENAESLIHAIRILNGEITPAILDERRGAKRIDLDTLSPQDLRDDFRRINSPDQ